MKIPVSPPYQGKLLFSDLSIERASHILRTPRSPLQGGKYRHWDTLRHLKPPTGLTSQEWWISIKLARQAMYRSLPFSDKTGNPFVFAAPDPLLRMLYQSDRDASGSIHAPTQVTDPGTRETYLISSLVEEAITSSQLEGASTTRNVAKEMIKQGRDPHNRSERMILNNYKGMQFVRRFVGQSITPSLIVELQSILTEGTLDEKDAIGRLRTEDDKIAVMDEFGKVLHRPPSASELPQRLQIICDFANEFADKSEDGVDGLLSENWIHPVVRSILIHFMIGYDHPFVDGNGRTARALFYWSMASQGYWLAEFVSISRILKKSRASYSRSYLYTETDDNDTTYFILNQLNVFLTAIKDLHIYLGLKAQEMKNAENAIRDYLHINQRLNERQLALVNNALKNADAQYTIESHRRSHGVAYETARKDLQELVNHGLLREEKIQRAYAYFPVPNLVNRLGG